MLRYYYGSLVHEDLISGGSCFKIYSKSKMKLTRETFLKSARLVPETDRDRNMAQHPMWIVPAPCSAINHVNVGR